jgi:thiamine-phosphate pyrophosphorylase
VTRRHLPRAWFFTDSRVGAALWDVLERLPRGTGVVVRGLSAADAARVRAAARRRGLVADGVHIGSTGRRVRGGLVTAAAHSRVELVRARRAGADLVFVSPVFATRSHAGAKGLGRVRFGLLTRGAGVKVAALGGVEARTARTVPGAYGWGGIDAWL